MKILLDLQAAQGNSRWRGIGRYSLALAKAMVAAGPEHDFYVLLNGAMNDSVSAIGLEFDRLMRRDKVLVWHGPTPTDWLRADNAPRRAAAELIREAMISHLEPDFVHVSSLMDGFDDPSISSIKTFAHVPTAVTFYDVIPLLQAEVYLKPHPTFAAMYHSRLEQMARADVFLAISEHSRQEAIRHLGVDPARAVNIAADTDPIFRPVDVLADEEAALRDKFGLDRPFILYSGASDERKNHLRLIAAYALLPPALRSAHQLVFAGRLPAPHRAKFEAYARALGVSERELVVTGGVTDDELVLLYNLAALFVMPSWHEGFGLPALEAMRCGAPVIGSNNTSIPEVIGNADALFDPFSARSIAAKMAQMLSSEPLRAELRAKGLVHSRRFSWDRSARIALDAFERLRAREQRQPPLSVDALIDRLGGALPRDTADDALRDIATGIATTFRQREERHLYVDVSRLIQSDLRTGIQRVVVNILRELVDDPPAGYAVTPVYAVDDTSWYRHARAFLRKEFAGAAADPAVGDEPIVPGVGDIFLGLDLHHRRPAPGVDIVERMRATGGYSYFVVYDLLPVQMPQYFPPGAPDQHLQWLREVAGSDGAVCISKAVADQVLDVLPGLDVGNPRRLNVGWFHLGADLRVDRSARAADDADEHDPVFVAMTRRPTFLMVGTLEPRKGHLQALIAFDRLWDEGVDVNLVVVGKYGWGVELQAELIRVNSRLDERLFWRDAMSDATLSRLYDGASCLLAASEGEGFGLPLIEAAERGLPVLARDLPVFREVGGDFASFFRGEDGDALADAVRGWLADDAAQRRLPAASRKRLGWRESKDQLLQAVLQGRWHGSGGKRVDVRHVASDCRFGSEVGLRTGTSMRSTHRDGFLLFGPYWRLPAGAYTLEVDASVFRAGTYRAEVSMQSGSDIFCFEEAAVREPGDLAMRFAFVRPADSERVEIRVRVDREIGLVVRSVVLTPLRRRA